MELSVLISGFVDAPLIIALSVLLTHILERHSSSNIFITFPFLQQKRGQLQVKEEDLRPDLEICAVWVVASLHISPEHPALLVTVKSLPVLVVDTRGQRLPVVDPDIVLVTALYPSPGKTENN